MSLNDFMKNMFSVIQQANKALAVVGGLIVIIVIMLIIWSDNSNITTKETMMNKALDDKPKENKEK